MLEIEMKFPVPDHAPILAIVQGWGATFRADRQEADHYFNAPDRDLRKTDEAFRIRCVGDKNCLTYKGPRRPGPTKTRPEIEIPFAEGKDTYQQMVTMLQNLGFRPVAVVRKHRVIFEMKRDGFHLEFCFDELFEVGKFMEIEIVAGEADFEKASATLLKVAAELGLKETEKRSYLLLWLEHLSKK